MNYRGTSLQIDLEAIRNNLTYINVLTENRPILLPVKADAYGHGLVEVSRFVEQEELVAMLGVASIEEGIILREAGINLPILILSYILPFEEHIQALFSYNLTPTIGDYASAKAINAQAISFNQTIKIHVKCDTGMGRLGAPADAVVAMCKRFILLDNIEIEGFFSHMPVSDEEGNRFNSIQIQIFTNLVKEVTVTLGKRPIVHLANSAAVLFHKSSHFDMVRPGIMSYGYLPDPSLSIQTDLQPAMSLYSTILHIKEVEQGTALSYGHTYKTEKSCFIATIACGYGDGYSRKLSNNATVFIDGHIFPVVGRVCMDLLLVNCNTNFFEIGTKVELFGINNESVEDVARRIGTIPYEICCNMARRIARSYK